MTTHLEAADIVKRALPALSLREQMLVRAIGLIESHYGDGWPKGKEHGEGSNNWGAVTAGKSWGNGPTFEAKDHYVDAQGQVVNYTTKFRVYPTPEDGAIDVAHIALKDNVKIAVGLGDVLGISRALKDSNYYGGNQIQGQAREDLIHAHSDKLKNAIGGILKGTGESDPFILKPIPEGTITPSSDDGNKVKLLIAGAVLVFIYLVIGAKKYGPERDRETSVA